LGTTIGNVKISPIYNGSNLEYIYSFLGSGNLYLTSSAILISNIGAPADPFSTPIIYSPGASSGITGGGATTSALSSVRFLAAGGGGGSGGNAGSAGGAGGVLTSNTLSISPGVTYNITIGAGGAASNGSDPASGTAGTSTTIVGGALNITALGGGAGRGASAPYSSPVHGGGSGGGAPGENTTVGAASNFPSPSALFYTPTGAQGYPGVAGGGSGANRSAGGGGGAGGSAVAPGGPGFSPQGGIGINLDIEGSPKYYAGGGGGGSHVNSGPTAGGLGGGGNGGNGPSATAGSVGWTNYGGGAGAGSGFSGAGAAGGSGIVIFAHPVAAGGTATTFGSNVSVITASGNTIYRFYSPGTITF
jgi:hypothetical protein